MKPLFRAAARSLLESLGRPYLVGTSLKRLPPDRAWIFPFSFLVPNFAQSVLVLLSHASHGSLQITKFLTVSSLPSADKKRALIGSGLTFQRRDLGFSFGSGLHYIQSLPMLPPRRPFRRSPVLSLSPIGILLGRPTSRRYHDHVFGSLLRLSPF